MKTLRVYFFDELPIGYNLVISFEKHSHWAASTKSLFRCLCGLPASDIPCSVYLFSITSEIKIKGSREFSSQLFSAETLDKWC